MLGRCSLHHRFPVCSSGGNSNRKSFSGVSLVSAFFLVVPGHRGVAGRAGPPRRSRHGVALGPAVCPEMEGRLHSRLRPTNDSWRVDETYIRVKGQWVYLYRAVDSSGATIDFLLSANRDAAAAERFSARPRAGRIIRRRGSSTPTSTPVIRQRLCNSKPKVLWRKTADTDRYSISITFWNRIIGRLSAGSVQASISGLFGELGAQSPAMRRSI